MKRLITLIITAFILNCSNGEKILKVPRFAEKNSAIRVEAISPGEIVFLNYYGGDPYEVKVERMKVPHKGTYKYRPKGELVVYLFFDERDSLHWSEKLYTVITEGGRPLPHALQTLAYIFHNDSARAFLRVYAKAREVYPKVFSFYDHYLKSLVQLGKIGEEDAKDSLKGNADPKNITYLYAACKYASYLRDSSLMGEMLKTLKETFPDSVHTLLCEMEYYIIFHTIDSLIKKVETLSKHFKRYTTRAEFKSYYAAVVNKLAFKEMSPKTYRELYLNLLSPEKRTVSDYYPLAYIYIFKGDSIMAKAVIDTIEALYSDKKNRMANLAVERTFTSFKKMRNFERRDYVSWELKKKIGPLVNLKLTYLEAFKKYDTLYKLLKPLFEKSPGRLSYHLYNFGTAALAVGDTLSYIKAYATLYHYMGDTFALNLVKQIFPDITSDSLKKLVRLDTLKSFKATCLNGDTLTKEDIKGKVVVINFWATWCTPCVEEIPELNKVVERFRDKKILFVALTEEDPRHVREFLKSKPFKYTVCAKAKEMFDEYAVSGVPTHMVVSPTGVIVLRRMGEISSDRLSWILNRFLSRPRM